MGRNLEPPGGEAIYEFEITGELDSHAVEALRLEIQRLARRHGASLEDFQSERLPAS